MRRFALLFFLYFSVWMWNNGSLAAEEPAGLGGRPANSKLHHRPQLLRKVDEDLALADLVSYLTSLTSGQNFYLVYDDLIPGTEVVVRLLQMKGDTTLLPYDPAFQLLTKTLRSSRMKNVFVLCSAEHVTRLFEQVRSKVLESTSIQWLVIVEEDLKEELEALLREGTQVALIQWITPQRALLFSSRVNNDGKIRFLQVESWSVGGVQSANSQKVKDELVPDLQQLYFDLQGRKLVVTTINNPPFVNIEVLENGTVLPISGVDLNLIHTLSEKLNFTYQLVRPPDGKWGGPQPDNTITGLVGQVARHEAHVALCELTITSIRETAVDFTVPYYLESTTLVSPAPKKKNRSFAVFSPFTVDVWLCICLVTLLMGPVLYLVTRLLVVYMGEEDRAHYSLQNLSFNMYRNLMAQNNLIRSSRWSLRCIFFFWYLFSFYIYAVYSGTLTSVLAIPAFEKPIDSLQDLAKAQQNGYTISTTRDSSFESDMKAAKEGIYYEVWQLFKRENPDKSLLLDPEAGFIMILKEKYVFMNAQLSSKMKATYHGRDRFHLSRQTFLSQYYGVACSSGSPLKDIFSRVLTRLTEAGMVDKWGSDEISRVSHASSSSGNTDQIIINLEHLQAAFFILLMGFSISAVILGLEIIASRWGQGKKTTRIERVVIHVRNHQSSSRHPARGPWITNRNPVSRRVII